MQILLTGASGFIGKHLIEALLQHDHTITVVSRDVERTRTKLPAPIKLIDWEPAGLKKAISQSNVVINLAGEPIASGRWTQSKKISIVNSRMHASQRLLAAMQNLQKKPELFMQCSAIGYYGHSLDEKFDVYSPPGEGFLAEVCQKWESNNEAINTLCGRLVTLRVGLVLGKDGGMLKELVKQSKRGMAGKVGSGMQWMSWIHIYDLVYAIMYLMNREEAKGPYNLVVKHAARQKEFARSLAKTTSRKFQLPAPSFMIKVILGEMGKELILTGQNVSPSKLIREGFVYKFESLEAALADLLH